MKEFDSNRDVKEKAKVEITQQKDQEYQLVYQSTIIPHSGHILYEINTQTLEILKAKYHKKDYVFRSKWKKGDRDAVNSEVIINEGMVYVSALNEENAFKQYANDSSGTKIDHKNEYLSL